MLISYRCSGFLPCENCWYSRVVGVWERERRKVSSPIFGLRLWYSLCTSLNQARNVIECLFQRCVGMFTMCSVPGRKLNQHLRDEETRTASRVEPRVSRSLSRDKADDALMMITGNAIRVSHLGQLLHRLSLALALVLSPNCNCSTALVSVYVDPLPKPQSALVDEELNVNVYVDRQPATLLRDWV